jgi:hypothetical protein
MNTAVIEIRNDMAYSFLCNLERMDLLRILSRGKTNELENKKQKPSDFFCTLSIEEGEKFQNHVINSRLEWDRNI